MASGDDRFEWEAGGGSFVVGLLAGTVLGAGLGMLFAPKGGSGLRHDSEGGGDLPETRPENHAHTPEAAVSTAEPDANGRTGASESHRS
jgi:gas vesicle protein